MSLTVDKLTMRFGGVAALDGVSLEAADGRITALIGPNGAGKSTLVNVVTGAYRAQEGEVRLGDRVLNKLPVHRIAALGLARTFQNVRLFDSMTVVENLRVATDSWARDHRSADAEIERAVARLGIEQWRDRKAAGLPYGIRRMVEIGRALALRPKFLLLDEPAAGLNETEMAALSVAVRSIQEDGIGMLLIEHNMPFVMDLADHVYCLHYGRNLADGDPVSVQRDDAVIEAYLGKERADAQG